MNTSRIAILDVVAERERQIDQEGWTPEHDDEEHQGGELALAAKCYVDHAVQRRWVYEGLVDGVATYQSEQPDACEWPWESAAWKPKDPRRDLVRAAALIVAEIERMDRVAAKGKN